MIPKDLQNGFQIFQPQIGVLIIGLSTNFGLSPLLRCIAIPHQRFWPQMTLWSVRLSFLFVLNYCISRHFDTRRAQLYVFTRNSKKRSKLIILIRANERNLQGKARVNVPSKQLHFTMTQPSDWRSSFYCEKVTFSSSNNLATAICCTCLPGIASKKARKLFVLGYLIKFWQMDIILINFNSPWLICDRTVIFSCIY